MKRILDKRGVHRDLRGGGWFRLLPQAGNLLFGEKLRKLTAEKRAELELPIDADLIDVLGLAAYSALNARAMVGTVAMEWGDFDRPDGSPIPCLCPDGSLDEEAGVEIILFPGVGDDLGDAFDSLNQTAVKNQELAEGNSSEPSGGTSATGGS